MTEEMAVVYRKGFSDGRASVLGTTSPHFFEAVVPGAPVPKGRPRVVIGKHGAHTYTPERTRSWESRATAFFLKAGANRLDRSLVVDKPLLLMVEMAGRVSEDGAVRYDRGRPDLDNVVKIVGDALAPSRTQKKAWTRVLPDDAGICGLVAFKRTLGPDEEPFVRVRLLSLPDVCVAGL